MNQKRFNRKARDLAVTLIRRGVTLREAAWLFRNAVKDAALEITSGNQSAAAEMLDTHRNVFNYEPGDGKRDLLREAGVR